MVPPIADRAWTKAAVILTTCLLAAACSVDAPPVTEPVTPAVVSRQPPTPPAQVTGSIVTLDAIGSFDEPVEVFARSADPRTFVVEQGGLLVAVAPGSTEVVLDVRDLTNAQGERGLLGAAFHPSNDLLYIYYTDDDGDSVLAEFAIETSTGIADRSSYRQVLTVDQPHNNHNGGELTFGPDGFLYLGLGDGGRANDPLRAALDLTSRLGKILRIDPLQSGGEPFTVPNDNPFVGVADADPTIWSLGLRNPWKFSFDPGTGDLWIADVGQNEYEEIDRAQAVDGVDAGRGLSFGWSAYEGNERFNEDQVDPQHTPPFLTYPREDGACSVSGGSVYRGSAIPELVGWYVFGDYCTGEIWGVDPSAAPVLVELARTESLVAIAQGGDGELYAVSLDGVVSRLGRDPAK